MQCKIRGVPLLKRGLEPKWLRTDPTEGKEAAGSSSNKEEYWSVSGVLGGTKILIVVLL